MVRPRATQGPETKVALETNQDRARPTQGLLQHLSLNFGTQVWKQFRGWLRTMDPARPPSELVTGQALRDRLPEFLDVLARELNAKKLLRKYRLPLRRRKRRHAA